MSNNGNTASPPGFIQTQYAFTRHIRDPQHVPCPADVEQRRMRIYSELFYNNVESFIADSFPVLRQITDDEAWHEMIRDYFQRHKAKTPLFPELPREFLYYLEHERQASEQDYPFMLELAHYEWLELALSLSELEPDQEIIQGDLLHGVPVLSPLAWLFSYRYPVHQIGPDFLPDEAPQQPSYLLLYRDAEDEVHFMELNPVTARLIHLIQENAQQSSEQMLLEIAREIQHPEPGLVIQAGMDILQDLQTRGVVLGVLPNT